MAAAAAAVAVWCVVVVVVVVVGAHRCLCLSRTLGGAKCVIPAVFLACSRHSGCSELRLRVHFHTERVFPT